MARKMARKRSLRGRPLGLALLAGVLAATLFLGFRSFALARSADRFLALPEDPRVRYEPGAEAMAEEIARALPDAIRAVEERQYRRFREPPRVFVCASLATFGSFGGDVRSGAYLARGRLFFSPKPENTPGRIPRLVAHELSHLHLEEGLSLLEKRRLPPWFEEGLAALVSDGGGAEGVSEEEALAAVASGRAFAPVESGGLLFRRTGAADGLPPHLFYREAEAFLGALRLRDGEAFRRLVAAVEEGRAVGEAFRSGYGESLEAAFGSFAREARAAGAGR